MKVFNIYKKFVDDYWKKLRPKQIVLPENIQLLLIKMYPTINWDNVSFYEGLPWFISSKLAKGIALPSVYNTHKLKVYLKAFNFQTNKDIGLIIHEVYHVLQYQEIGVKGFGFFRPFMVKYFALWIGGGFKYRTHKMEVPAYDHESNYYKAIRKLKVNLCEETFSHEMIDSLLEEFPELIKEETGEYYRSGIMYSVLGGFLNITLSIFIPLAELFLFIFAFMFSLPYLLIVRVFKK